MRTPFVKGSFDITFKQLQGLRSFGDQVIPGDRRGGRLFALGPASERRSVSAWRHGGNNMLKRASRIDIETTGMLASIDIPKT